MELTLDTIPNDVLRLIDDRADYPVLREVSKHFASVIPRYSKRRQEIAAVVIAMYQSTTTLEWYLNRYNIPPTIKFPPIFDLFIDKYRKGKLAQLDEYAALAGNFDNTCLLIHGDTTKHNYVSPYAAYGGHLNIVQWFYYTYGGLPICSNVQDGNIPMLQWLCALSPPNEREFASTAHNGHLVNLQWLRARGYPWDEGAIILALMSSHMDIVRWLIQNGCPRQSPDIIYAAVVFTGTNTVQWLRQNGCPWSHDCVPIVIEDGDLTRLKWLITNGCPFDQFEMYNVAIEHFQYEILDWLVDGNYQISYDDAHQLMAYWIVNDDINAKRILDKMVKNGILDDYPSVDDESDEPDGLIVRTNDISHRYISSDK